MRLQIDTGRKTIKVDEAVKIDKLVATLRKMFPNDEWKEFTLETNTTIQYWTNPVIIKEYPRPYYQEWPWYKGGSYTATRGSAGSGTLHADYKDVSVDNQIKSLSVTPGIYNVQV